MGAEHVNVAIVGHSHSATGSVEHTVQQTLKSSSYIYPMHMRNVIFFPRSTVWQCICARTGIKNH